MSRVDWYSVDDAGWCSSSVYEGATTAFLVLWQQYFQLDILSIQSFQAIFVTILQDVFPDFLLDTATTGVELFVGHAGVCVGVGARPYCSKG